MSLSWDPRLRARAEPGVSELKELEVHLERPGWYWIDFEEGDFQLHQQVPFELAADVAGSMRFGYSGGVASFWFEPTRGPRVIVEASTELDLHGSTLWGSLLGRIPLLPVREITAERLSDSAARAFAVQFQRGVTVTYDGMRGQADMALGALRPGETAGEPERFHPTSSRRAARWWGRVLTSRASTAAHAPLISSLRARGRRLRSWRCG